MKSLNKQNIKLSFPTGKNFKPGTNEINLKNTLTQHKVITYIDATSLVSILEGLENIEQIVLSLHYDQGLNFKEVSAVLGISELGAIDIFNISMQKIHTQTSQDTPF